MSTTQDREAISGNTQSSSNSYIHQPALQLIYDTAPIGLAFLSPDCRYLQINRHLTEICGISVEDHLGRYVRDCVPALADAVEGIVKSIVETGDPVIGVEVAGQRPGHHAKRSWITYWHPLRAPNGDVIGINVAAEEITQRKRAEAALQASERQFHTLVDAIPQLVWMADGAGKIFWFNSRWYDYTGQADGDAMAHDWCAVLAPEMLPDARQQWNQALASQTPLEMELSMRGHDARYRSFLTRVVPLRQAADEVYGWIGTHIDISERKRSEEEIRSAKDAAEAALTNLRETQNSLIEAEKLAALGRLVAGVAHEINTPVGLSLTIATALEQKRASFVEKVLQGELRRSDLQEFLEDTRTASSQLSANLTRAAELVSSFKQVATDRSQSDRRTFNAGDLTEQVLTSLRPSVRKHDLTLKVRCQPDLTMESYPGPYGQVLTNLFANAVMHAFADGKPGTVDIAVGAHGQDEVEVVFADDGCGMSFAVKREALNPFFTTRRAQGCTGLGLHIVHTLVTQQLGGHLALESESDEGTTVRMILPRVAPIPAVAPG